MAQSLLLQLFLSRRDVPPKGPYKQLDLVQINLQKYLQDQPTRTVSVSILIISQRGPRVWATAM